jgi:hypothetical protein
VRTWGAGGETTRYGCLTPCLGWEAGGDGEAGCRRAVVDLDAEDKMGREEDEARSRGDMELEGEDEKPTKSLVR